MTLAMLPVALMLLTGCGPNAEESSAEDFEAKLARARADYEAEPENADAMIWLGRRLAYLGRYQEAIEVYSQGIELHPEDARAPREHRSGLAGRSRPGPGGRRHRP